MIVAEDKSMLQRLLELGAEVGGALVGAAAGKSAKPSGEGCGGCPSERAKIDKSRKAQPAPQRAGFRRMR